MHPKANAILAFQRSFLDSVRHTGRLHEVGMVAAYKLRTGHLLQDVLLAPRLFARGKLHPLPRAIEDKASIARIFERTADDKASRP
jgi:heterodisulfide reductase subunit C